MIKQLIFCVVTLFVNSIVGQSWTQVDEGSFFPFHRAENALAPIPGGFYIFGGYGGSHILDCFWIFSTESSSWSRFTAEVDIYGGPSARYGHRAQFVSDQLFVFGGENIFQGSGNYFNELWVWQKNPTAKEWKSYAPSNGPSGRSFSTLSTVDQTNLFLFGGKNESGFLGDYWILDTKSKSWSKISSGGKASEPIARADHTQIQVSDSEILIFGGQTSASRVVSDLWQYNTQTKSWKLLDIGGTGPQSRKGHAAAFDSSSKKMYIFGGDNLNTVFDDTWSYDLGNGKWEKMNVGSNNAPARSNLGYGAFDNGSFYIFGGTSGVTLGSDNENNDMWSFQP